MITCDYLPPAVVCGEAILTPPIDGAIRVATAERSDGAGSEPVERRLVESALAASMGNKIKAARLLGMTRAQFFSHLAKYGRHLISSLRREMTPSRERRNFTHPARSG